MDHNLAKTIAIGVGIAGLSFVAGAYFFSQLGNKQPTINLSITDGSDIAVNDDRPEVSTSDLNQELEKKEMIEVCNNLPKLNTAASDANINFENKELGFSVTLPYNDAWGSDIFKVKPVEAGTDGVSFGPVITYGEGGCGFGRKYTILKIPTRDSGAIFSHAEDNGVEVTSFADTEFAGKHIMRYKNDGMCGNEQYEIVGKEYNYVVSSFCNDSSLESDAEIIQVIKSFKFI